MSISYRFYLLDDNSRVVGAVHGDFAADNVALACASDMLKGSLGVEVWQEDRLVGRLTQKREAFDEVIGGQSDHGGGAERAPPGPSHGLH
jgi:hypothetical protein